VRLQEMIADIPSHMKRKQGHKDAKALLKLLMSGAVTPKVEDTNTSTSISTSVEEVENQNRMTNTNEHNNNNNNNNNNYNENKNNNHNINTNSNNNDHNRELQNKDYDDIDLESYESQNQYAAAEKRLRLLQRPPVCMRCYQLSHYGTSKGNIQVGSPAEIRTLLNSCFKDPTRNIQHS